MTLSRQRWEHEKILGAQAARAGRKEHQAPKFGTSQDERDREEAWWIGYRSVKPKAVGA